MIHRRKLNKLQEKKFSTEQNKARKIVQDHGMFRGLVRSGVAGLERGEDGAGVELKPRQGPALGETQEQQEEKEALSRERVAIQGFREQRHDYTFMFKTKSH